MGNLRGWEWIIILLLALLLFGGFKKLPDAARGLGRSLRIFKSETKGLVEDDKEDGATPPPPPSAVTAAEAMPDASAASPVPEPVASTKSPPPPPPPATPAS